MNTEKESFNFTKLLEEESLTTEEVVETFEKCKKWWKEITPELEFKLDSHFTFYANSEIELPETDWSAYQVYVQITLLEEKREHFPKGLQKIHMNLAKCISIFFSYNRTYQLAKLYHIYCESLEHSKLQFINDVSSNIKDSDNSDLGRIIEGQSVQFEISMEEDGVYIDNKNKSLETFKKIGKFRIA